MEASNDVNIAGLLRSDAYMGVTNIVEDQSEEHVRLIAEFAVDMIDEASKILIDEDEPDKGYIKIRVGFHSGPGTYIRIRIPVASVGDQTSHLLVPGPSPSGEQCHWQFEPSLWIIRRHCQVSPTFVQFSFKNGCLLSNSSIFFHRVHYQHCLENGE